MSDIPRQLSIECIQCKKPFEIITPMADIIESKTVSAIVWAHPETQDCPFCGQPYQMAISKLKGFEISWMAMKKQGDQSRIITVPAGAIPKSS